MDAGMLRYNSDYKYFQRSIDEGSNWSELDLTGTTLLAPPFYGSQSDTTLTGNQIIDPMVNFGVTILRCNNASLLTILGLVPPVITVGILIIKSIGAGAVRIEHLHATPGPPEKISHPFANYLLLEPGKGTAIYFYDTVISKWVLISSENIGGTWTPFDDSGAGLTFTSPSGYWKRQGSLIFVHWQLTYPVTANATSAKIGGLPFSVVKTMGFNISWGIANMYLWAQGGSTNIFPLKAGAGGSAELNSDLSNSALYGSGFYWDA